MSKVLVCGKWELDLSALPPSTSDQSHLPPRERSHAHYVSPLGIRDLAGYVPPCFEFILTKLKQRAEIRTVVEAFGGVGLTSTLVREILKPSEHFIFEQDEACAAHLKARFPGAHVFAGDAFHLVEEVEIPEDALVIADHYFTLLRSKSLYPFLRSKWAAFTDTSLFMLHVNCASYSKHLDREVTVDPESVMEAWNGLLPGYKVVASGHHSRSAYTLVEKTDGERVSEIREFRQSGVELLEK